MRVASKQTLNDNIIDSLISSVISDIQSETKDLNIYDEINNCNKNDNDSLDLILKYYLLQKIIKFVNDLTETQKSHQFLRLITNTSLETMVLY